MWPAHAWKRGVAFPVMVLLLSGCGADASFAGMLARTTVLLVLVCGLAVVTLRLAARAGIGTIGSRDGKRLALLDELPVGGRTSVVAIRAGGRVIVAARGPNGMQGLATLSEAEWDGAPSFADVLAQTPRPDRGGEGGVQDDGDVFAASRDPGSDPDPFSEIVA